MRPCDFPQPMWLEDELSVLRAAQPYHNMPLLVLDASNVIYREAFAKQESLLPGDDQFNDDYLIEVVLRAIDELMTITSSLGAVLVFDSPTPSFRVDLKEDQYKQDKMDKYPHVRQCAKRVLTRLRTEVTGCAVLEADAYEADDMIACMAMVENLDNMIVVSSDEDLCQTLVHSHVTVYNPGSKKFVTGAGYSKDKGIEPHEIPLYKAIVGDPSDNIAGVKGVGNTTFMRWYKDEDRGRVTDLITEHKRTILDNLDLITLPGIGAADAYLAARPTVVEEWKPMERSDEIFDKLSPPF